MKDTKRARLRRILDGWRPSATVADALGKLFAASPEGQDLLRDYKINLHRLSQSQRPAWIAQHAKEAGIDAASVFPPESEQVAERLGVDLQAAMHHSLGLYLSEYAASGNPPGIAPYFGQGSAVIDWPGPDGATMPVAIAWLTPYGSRAMAVANLQEAALALEDRKEAGVDAGTVDDLAKILIMQSYGLSSAEIAWEFLYERYPEIGSLDAESRQRDYAEQHHREMDRLRQVRGRGLDAVTRIVPSLSRFDD